MAQKRPWRFLSLAFLLLACEGTHGAKHAELARHALPLRQPLEEKNFFLLAAMQERPELRAALAHDEALEAIRMERLRALDQARVSCKEDLPCVLKAALWTEEEISAVARELEQAYVQSHSPLHALVRDRLRPSGAYAAYADRDDAALLAHAWEVCAGGLNEIVSVYGLGQAGRYPLIDAASVDPHSPALREQAGEELLHPSAAAQPFFFEPALAIALKLLAVNRRDEAARFEPMETGVNRAAVEAIHSIAWNRFPYTAIVVPGSGGGTEADPLTEIGRQRVDLAAQAFHAGKAPLLLVSGGYVHPSQTRFAEAVEMKKALMRDYGVPESAIVMDPHARHTTTNLRNAAREIFRYGIPMSRPALIVSGVHQIEYIKSEDFRDRCLREMGYLPFRSLEQVSETSLAFAPAEQSLEQDPVDPLDP